jgi:hypothetical protein
MKATVPFENAVDLLDADHKAVKKMFIDYNALCEDEAAADAKKALAQRICQALLVHAQIEEEIFYRAIRKATGDDALMDEALHEHAEAKDLIARIQGMKATSDNYDDTVKALGKAIDEHVLEELEQMFLEAQQAPLDLRGLAVPLYERKKQLMKAAAASGLLEPLKESARQHNSGESKHRECALVRIGRDRAVRATGRAHGNDGRARRGGCLRAAPRAKHSPADREESPPDDDRRG